MSKTPLVSVYMPVYNHENYLRDALDSVLMQKVNFEYEILVGEDCSTDNSREVLLEYKEKYPDKITLFLRDKNLGAKENSYDIKKRCRGKYLAPLEGDDYWLDENKLQKQVDFLEANPEYSAVSCKHKIVDKNKNFLPDITEAQLKSVVSGRLTKEIFENGYYPGQTATLMHKNFYLDNPEKYKRILDCYGSIGDVTTFTILLSMGDIYVMDEQLSAYRFVVETGGSNWASINARKNRALEKHTYKLTLERSVKEILDFDIDFFQHRFELFMTALKLMVKNPKKENISIFFKIAMQEPHKLRLIKCFFKRIFKK